MNVTCDHYTDTLVVFLRDITLRPKSTQRDELKNTIASLRSQYTVLQEQVKVDRERVRDQEQEIARLQRNARMAEQAASTALRQAEADHDRQSAALRREKQALETERRLLQTVSLTSLHLPQKIELTLELGIGRQKFERTENTLRETQSQVRKVQQQLRETRVQLQEKAHEYQTIEAEHGLAKEVSVDTSMNSISSLTVKHHKNRISRASRSGL